METARRLMTQKSGRNWTDERKSLWKKKIKLFRKLIHQVELILIMLLKNISYLDYSLSRTSLFLELLPPSYEHFHQMRINFLSLSWSSLSKTFLYLEQKFRSCCNYFRPILNFLLACSVIQVSWRVNHTNTVESF